MCEGMHAILLAMRISPLKNKKEGSRQPVRALLVRCIGRPAPPLDKSPPACWKKQFVGGNSGFGDGDRFLRHPRCWPCPSLLFLFVREFSWKLYVWEICKEQRIIILGIYLQQPQDDLTADSAILQRSMLISFAVANSSNSNATCLLSRKIICNPGGNKALRYRHVRESSHLPANVVYVEIFQTTCTSLAQHSPPTMRRCETERNIQITYTYDICAFTGGF